MYIGQVFFAPTDQEWVLRNVTALGQPVFVGPELMRADIVMTEEQRALLSPLYGGPMIWVVWDLDEIVPAKSQFTEALVQEFEARVGSKPFRFAPKTQDRLVAALKDAIQAALEAVKPAEPSAGD